MEINKIITRRYDDRENKLWLTTNSFLTGYSDGLGLCKWANCLYIHFRKKDYPLFCYPKEDGSYYDSSFASLDMHGGITFYEESTVNGVTLVKVGCDYQHLYDEEDYGLSDSGERILLNDGTILINSFLSIYKELSLKKDD